MMQRKQNYMVALIKIPTCFEIETITVIAMGCPTGTSLEPSGTNILAKYLKNAHDQKSLSQVLSQMERVQENQSS